MKTILVLAPTPVLPDSIRKLLPLDEYQLLHLAEPGDVEPFARSSLLNTCIVDAEEGDVRALWMIERFRRLAPNTPIIVFKGAAWEWEEDAYLKGVSAVLSKPVRAQILLSMLERLCKFAPGAFSSAREREHSAPGFRAVAENVPESGSLMAGPPALACQQSIAQQALQVLHGLSGVPSPSLGAEVMLGPFLLFLREMLGVGMGMAPFRADIRGCGDGAWQDRGGKAAANDGRESGRLLDAYRQWQPARGQGIYNFTVGPLPQQHGGWLESVLRMVQARAREEQLRRLELQAEWYTRFSSLHETGCFQPQEGFRGMLRQVGLQDLLQMECLSRHSTLLEITTKEGRGMLYIFEGQIVHAEASGRTGAEAFNFLMGLSGGEFVQKPYANPPQRTITGSWEFLLMEAARQFDEASQNGEATDTQVSDIPQLRAAPAPLPPAEAKQLQQALSTSPWGDIALSQISESCLPMAAAA